MPDIAQCPWCRLNKWIPQSFTPYCTRACRDEARRAVTCCICGEAWLPESPLVTYRSEDHRWWCASRPSCAARAAERTSDLDLLRMKKALAAAWAALDDCIGRSDGEPPA